MRLELPIAAFALLLAACATTPEPSPRPEPEPAGAEEVAAAAGGGDAEAAEPVDAGGEEKEVERGDVEGVRRALAEVVDEGAPYDDLHLLVGCLKDGKFRMLSVWGNGVAIWDEESQFRFTHDELLGLLAAVRDSGFAGMKVSWGGKHDPVPQEEREEGRSAIQVTCRVDLTLRGASKAVTQQWGGRQSEELLALADELFAAARAEAVAGVSADTLGDGLQKIASGELAPEAFRLLVHRRPERSGEVTEGPGWLLRVDGLEATLRPYLPSGGMDEPLVTELSPERLAAVAELLAEQSVGGLPTNLWASYYTDVNVKVLEHKTGIQARGFAGMDAGTHGEDQERFDRLYAGLAELAREVLASGRPAPSVQE